MKLCNAAESAHEFLEQTGLDPTLNRILILSAVVASGHPLTAREVFEAVLDEHKINRVTVYRILDLLADKGAINRISTGERALHFCVGHDHSHFHCTQCGQVQCIENTTLQFDEDAIANSVGMTVKTIALHLEGVCENCNNHSV